MRRKQSGVSSLKEPFNSNRVHSKHGDISYLSDPEMEDEMDDNDTYKEMQVGEESDIIAKHWIAVKYTKQGSAVTWIPDAAMYEHKDDPVKLESYMSNLCQMWDIGSVDRYDFGFGSFGLYRSGVKVGRKQLNKQEFNKIINYKIGNNFDWTDNSYCFILQQKSKEQLKLLKAESFDTMCEMDKKTQKRLQKYNETRKKLVARSIVTGESMSFESNNISNDLRNQSKLMVATQWNEWIEKDADAGIKAFFDNHILSDFNKMQIYCERESKGRPWKDIAELVKKSIIRDHKVGINYEKQCSKSTTKTKSNDNNNNSNNSSNNSNNNEEATQTPEERVRELELQVVKLKSLLESAHDQLKQREYYDMKHGSSLSHENMIPYGSSIHGINGVGFYHGRPKHSKMDNVLNNEMNDIYNRDMDDDLYDYIDAPGMGKHGMRGMNLRQMRDYERASNMMSMSSMNGINSMHGIDSMNSLRTSRYSGSARANNIARASYMRGIRDHGRTRDYDAYDIHQHGDIRDNNSRDGRNDINSNMYNMDSIHSVSKVHSMNNVHSMDNIHGMGNIHGVRNMRDMGHSRNNNDNGNVGDIRKLGNIISKPDINSYGTSSIGLSNDFNQISSTSDPKVSGVSNLSPNINASMKDIKMNHELPPSLLSLQGLPDMSNIINTRINGVRKDDEMNISKNENIHNANNTKTRPLPSLPQL